MSAMFNSFKRKALQDLEDGWGGEDLPADTRVVLAEEVPGVDLPARTVVTYAPGAEPYRPEAEPRVVAINDSPENEALRAAKKQDVQAYNARVRELAARQLVGAITRTDVPDVVTPLGTSEKDLRAQLAQRRADALREVEAETNKTRADTYARQVDAGFANSAGKTDRLKTQQDFEREKLEESKRKALVDEDIKRRALDLKEKFGNKPKAMKAPKPTAAPESPDEVPFGNEVFVYGGSATGDKEVRRMGAKQVRESAAKWSTTIAGLDALESALSRFVADPTPRNKALLEGPALTAAGATNAAIGQGAMSDAEKQAQFSALGIRFGDVAGFQSLVERALGDPSVADDVLARVRQMKALARASVEAQARPYGYVPRGAAATRSAAPAASPAADGDVTLVDDDGNEYDVPAAKVESILKAKPNLRRK